MTPQSTYRGGVGGGRASTPSPAWATPESGRCHSVCSVDDSVDDSHDSSELIRPKAGEEVYLFMLKSV